MMAKLHLLTGKNQKRKEGYRFINVSAVVMNDNVLLVDFFGAVQTDPRVNCRHISLYTALFRQWVAAGFQNPLEMFSKEVMELCKISASSTYHKTIRELHEFGYILYAASFNHNKRSRIYLLEIINRKK
jgi:hypothetical protein